MTPGRRAASRQALSARIDSSSSAAGYAAGWDVYLRRLDEFVAGREVRDTWSEDWSSANEGYAAQLG